MTKLLTVNDVVEQTRLSLASVYRLIKSGRLPHVRPGVGRRAIRIRQEDLERYLKEEEPAYCSEPESIAGRAGRFRGRSSGRFPHLGL